MIQQIAAEAVGKNLHVVQRKIDPKMFELNASGDAYNGHISITMLYSFIAVLYATLTSDYRYVVTSCEASSSIGNVEYLGIQVNHQWSKSIEAEEIIKDYIKKFVSVDVAVSYTHLDVYKRQICIGNPGRCDSEGSVSYTHLI